MSFSFRDKPRLSDRLRGKSGDEIFDELKKAMDENKKEREQRRNTFFESTPKWESSRAPRADTFFSQAGYPFDDDFKSRIDNLAQRHPESADLLRNIIGNTFPKTDTGNSSNSNGDVTKQNPAEGFNSNSRHQPNPNQETQDSNKENINNEIKQNLSEDSVRNRSTVGQEEDDSRNQRSWSAPPEGKSAEPQQRFVSKIEINPINPDEQPPKMNNTADQQQHEAQPQQKSNQPNVRHIPIFVEGRSEPVLPKELPTEEVFVQQRGPTPTFNSRSAQQQHQPSPKKSTEKQHFIHHEPVHAAGNQHQQYAPKPQQHQQQQPKQQQQKHQQPEQHHHQQNEESNENVEQAPPPPPPPAPPKPKTALEKVEAVQNEVDDLRKQVNEFQGKSRTEKPYLYLDEMLTRELIKLDNIETEGKEDVRMARKNAIKSIQNAISVLESKVPLPPSTPNNLENETSVVVYSGDTNSESAGPTNSEQMEIESSNNSTQEISTDESSEIKKKKNDQ